MKDNFITRHMSRIEKLSDQYKIIYKEEKEPLRGQIAITKTEIVGWGKIDFFKHCLKRFTDDPCAGWYAYILRNGTYYFLWCENKFKLNREYLEALKTDGYTLAYNTSENKSK